MHARPIATACVGAALAVSAFTGLTACSSSGTTSTPAAASEANLSGEPVSAKDELTALCEQIVAEALPLDAANALAEASGYITRVGTLDGQPQALTTDAREDRFTFDVEADVVVGCTVG